MYADFLGRFNPELMKNGPKCNFIMITHQLIRPQLLQQNWSNYALWNGAYNPPYSPDPCEYVLFPNMRKWIDWMRFTVNEEFIAENMTYFEEFDRFVNYFLDGLKK